MCFPNSWTGYVGVTCGPCSALVNIQKYESSCAVFCAAQELSCLDAWDDIIDDTCSPSAERLGCSHIWYDGSYGADVICKCGPPGEIFICYCLQFYYINI